MIKTKECPICKASYSADLIEKYLVCNRCDQLIGLIQESFKYLDYQKETIPSILRRLSYKINKPEIKKRND